MLVEFIKGDRCCLMNYFDFDGYEEMGGGGELEQYVGFLLILIGCFFCRCFYI